MYTNARHGCVCRCRLAKKIRAARVNKERALQLQEKASLAAQEAEYDKAYDTMLMTQDRAGVAAQAAADVARREAGKLGMKALEQQVQVSAAVEGS